MCLVEKCCCWSLIVGCWWAVGLRLMGGLISVVAIFFYEEQSFKIALAVLGILSIFGGIFLWIGISKGNKTLIVIGVVLGYPLRIAGLFFLPLEIYLTIVIYSYVKTELS